MRCFAAPAAAAAAGGGVEATSSLVSFFFAETVATMTVAGSTDADLKMLLMSPYIYFPFLHG